MESYFNGDHLHLLDHLYDDTRSRRKDSYDIGDHIDESDILHRGGGISLVDALFDHLHSNSITQIVQRLLMPKPPNSKGSDEDGAGDENDAGSHNGLGGNDTNDSDGEEYDNENLITSGVEEFGNVNCNWSDGEYAIHLLLERLLGESNELDELLEGDSVPHTN